MDAHAGAATDPLIGQTVGNYLVTQKVGEGGMGSVYLAEHPTIGKKVALKVLHSEFASNAEVAQRFFHEAKAVNDIGHPNIVDIIDYGILQGMLGRQQLVYFIMEYLHGTSVSQLIRQEAPLPPERALAIALQVADALAASHKCGIVHRDLKPDNIILIQRARERDFVKLLDFGIAKLTGEHGGNRTRTGIVMGTPAYMSPEQCDGKGLVDHRTDIYALGILLYEMLTGRVPFIGEGYGEVLVQHLTRPPAPPSQYRMLPPHVEIVVLKALEKRPDMRYPTMDEFMRAMADPVGYVEANGGIAGFLQRQLMPSTAPLELPPNRLSSALMGPPGISYTPAPGSITPVPANALHTMGSAPGVVGAAPPPRNRTIFVIAGVAVVAGAVAAIVIIASGAGHGKTANAGSGSGSADPGSAAVGSAPAPAPTPGSAVTVPHSADVRIETVPSGASVTINGLEKCLTPCTLPADPDGMIGIKLEGYEAVSRPLRADASGKLSVELVKTPTPGSAAPAAGSNAGSAAPAAGSNAGSAAPTAGSNAGSGAPTGHTAPPTGHTTPPTGHTTPPTGHTTPQGSGHHDADGTVRPGDI